MQQSTRNALGNVYNTAQGPARKVLCVCSAGLLRSPTLANLLNKEYGFNTRACGTSEYALIPLSQALVKWADDIVFVHKEVYDFTVATTPASMLEWVETMREKAIMLDVEDYYDYNHPDLVFQLKRQIVDVYGEVK